MARVGSALGGLDAVLTAIVSLYDAYGRPEGREAALDQELWGRLETARSAVISDLRGLRNEYLVREMDTLLTAYLPFATVRASDAASTSGTAWFMNAAIDLLVRLKGRADRGSLFEAQAAASAFNLLGAVNMMATRRLGEIHPQLKASASVLSSNFGTVLQTNYDLVGATAFGPAGGSVAIDTTRAGKLSRQGEGRVVLLVRAAMARIVALGYTQVTDRSQGPGRVIRG